VEQLNRGGTRVRCTPCAGAELDECIGLLAAGCENAARTMIFERAAHQLHVVGDESGCQGIPRVARIRGAVERELQWPVAIDEAPSLPPAHEVISIASLAAATSWVRVSRVTTSQERQPLA